MRPRHSPLVLAAMLVLLGCASASREPVHLRWTIVNGDETLAEYEFVGRQLRFERHGFPRRHRAEPEVDAVLTALVGDPAWQQELVELRRGFDPETTPVGGLAFILESAVPAGLLWARVPADEIPDSLRPFLEAIDDAFARTFPRSFEERWSTARPASDPRF